MSNQVDNQVVSLTSIASAMNEAKPTTSTKPEKNTGSTPKFLTPRQCGETDQAGSAKVTAGLIAALPDIKGETKEERKARFDAVRGEYVIGHMSKALKYTSEKAVAAHSKKDHKDNVESDERRTLAEQAAYKSANVAWGRALARADLKSASPNAGKQDRKARTPDASPETVKKASEQADALNEAARDAWAVPFLANIGEIEHEMMRIASYMVAMHKQNADKFTGDKGMVYRDLITGVTKDIQFEASRDASHDETATVQVAKAA